MAMALAFHWKTLEKHGKHVLYSSIIGHKGHSDQYVGFHGDVGREANDFSIVSTWKYSSITTKASWVTGMLPFTFQLSFLLSFHD